MEAFGGRADVMSHTAPLGAVYKAGTLSGNPVAVAAGVKTLDIIQRPSFYENLTEKTQRLTQGIAKVAETAGVAMSCDSVGGMFGYYLCKKIPARYSEVTDCDIEQFKRFFHAMLAQGIYLAPSAYEAGFVSAAHSDGQIEQTLHAVRSALSQL